jgi:DNA-binding NarL/FixJ family response regulator
MAIRLVIVDDHRVFAQGLQAMFSAEPDFEPVIAISDPQCALAVVRAQHADVVLMDIQLGCVSGIDLTAQLGALPAPPCVVVLTGYADLANAIAAVQAGAVGFVPKHAAAEHVVAAVRTAVAGGSWMPAALLSKAIAGAQHGQPAPVHQLIGQLTAREREVLALMVSGLDRQGISARLSQSPNTVRTHIRNVMVKLGCHSALEAVAIALRAGLRPELEPPTAPASAGGPSRARSA